MILLKLCNNVNRKKQNLITFFCLLCFKAVKTAGNKKTEQGHRDFIISGAFIFRNQDLPDSYSLRRQEDSGNQGLSILCRMRNI